MYKRQHLSEYWKIPPHHDAEFVTCMEDVLDVYQRPYDPSPSLHNADIIEGLDLHIGDMVYVEKGGEITLKAKRGQSFRAEAFMGIMRWEVLDRLKASHPELAVSYTHLFASLIVEHFPVGSEVESFAFVCRTEAVIVLVS